LFYSEHLFFDYGNLAVCTAFAPDGHNCTDNFGGLCSCDGSQRRIDRMAWNFLRAKKVICGLHSQMAANKQFSPIRIRVDIFFLLNNGFETQEHANTGVIFLLKYYWV
jgi:hypothetical protein